MEKLSRYLQQAGYQVTPAYWENTRYYIGDKFTLPPYQVILRLEKTQLIIGSVLRDEQYSQKKASLLRLKKCLKNILNYFPEILSVRGLIILDRWDERVARKQKKLQHLLLQGGGITETMDGDNWLVLSRSIFVDHQ